MQPFFVHLPWAQILLLHFILFFKINYRSRAQLPHCSESHAAIATSTRQTSKQTVSQARIFKYSNHLSNISLRYRACPCHICLQLHVWAWHRVRIIKFEKSKNKQVLQAVGHVIVSVSQASVIHSLLKKFQTARQRLTVLNLWRHNLIGRHADLKSIVFVTKRVNVNATTRIAQKTRKSLSWNGQEVMRDCAGRANWNAARKVRHAVHLLPGSAGEVPGWKPHRLTHLCWDAEENQFEVKLTIDEQIGYKCIKSFDFHTKKYFIDRAVK